MIIVDSKWLAFHLDDPNLVIIDTRDNISYRSRLEVSTLEFIPFLLIMSKPFS
jgi:hypothetical protein